MEIVYLNDISETVKKEIEKAQALSNFVSLDKKVGIFQSVDHDLEWSAVTVPKVDSQVLSPLYPQLSEIVPHFSKDLDLIVWVGKSAPQFPDLKKLFPHEFRHIQQQLEEPDLFAKDRALDCLKIFPPTEKDASDFAEKIINPSYNVSYDWKQDVDNIFQAQKKNIDKLYESLLAGQDEVVKTSPHRGVYTALWGDDGKAAAIHFFGKVV